MQSSSRVLILGSAPDAVRARNWARDGLGTIVAINNAWRVRPDWDVLVHPKDFPLDRRPASLTAGQALRSHADYVPAVNAHGGFVFVGGTMAFTASYWALEVLRPRVIAFLGCDMVYPAAGASHFYGTGTADPLRADPTLQSLEAKAARFQMRAAQAGCAAINLSALPTSRLTYPRTDPDALAHWSAADTRGAIDMLLSPEAVERAEEAQALEASLGYEVPSGKYWKEFARIDPAALRRVDALWLDAVRRYAVAA